MMNNMQNMMNNMKDSITIDIYQLKADVAGLRIDVAELKTEVAELKTEVVELKASSVAVDTSVKDLRNYFAKVNFSTRSTFLFCTAKFAWQSHNGLNTTLGAVVPYQIVMFEDGSDPTVEVSIGGPSLVATYRCV